MKHYMSEYVRILNAGTKEQVDETIFHNTQLLLELYPKVLKRISRRLNNIDQQCYETNNKHLYEFVTTLLNIDTQFVLEKIEEKLISVEKSAGLLNVMDKTLVLFKSGDNKDAIYYDILYCSYFQKNKYTSKVIMEKLDVSYATYFRYKKEAIREFAVNLWGFVIPELDHTIKEIM